MQGTYTALITPFKDDDLDEEGLRKNICYQIEEGIDGVLALGSTGEGQALTEEERLRVIQIAREESLGRVPLMVHTGECSTHRAIERAEEAERVGADSLLIVTPYYCRPTQEGLVRHFEAIARSTTLPIILYNHPKRTGVRFEVESVERLSQIKNIVGLKDASGDLGFVAELLNRIEDFSLFSGDDPLTLPLMSIGAVGVISILSNIFPRKVCELVRKRDKRLYHELFPLFQLSQCESNPIPIKAMMELIGMPAGECRLPLTPLSEKYHEQMRELLVTYV
ncbi:MAG: 4-hydroxy-tetrahydrodipicolinate synthase [Chlamydiae bacterium]|nr:4-hydroxy-tetrahydrodipicolinate synthase [Chlamydiota bacterium]